MLFYSFYAEHGLGDELCRLWFAGGARSTGAAVVAKNDIVVVLFLTRFYTHPPIAPEKKAVPRINHSQKWGKTKKTLPFP